MHKCRVRVPGLHAKAELVPAEEAAAVTLSTLRWRFLHVFEVIYPSSCEPLARISPIGRSCRAAMVTTSPVSTNRDWVERGYPSRR